MCRYIFWSTSVTCAGLPYIGERQHYWTGFSFSKNIGSYEWLRASLDMDLISVIKLLMYAASSLRSKPGDRNPISFDNDISAIRWQLLSKYRSDILRLRYFPFWAHLTYSYFFKSCKSIALDLLLFVLPSELRNNIFD